jgi:hypothetical protein
MALILIHNGSVSADSPIQWESISLRITGMSAGLAIVCPTCTLHLNLQSPSTRLFLHDAVLRHADNLTFYL